MQNTKGKIKEINFFLFSKKYTLVFSLSRMYQRYIGNILKYISLFDNFNFVIVKVLFFIYSII
jgi:uncharacterized membrane protein